MRLIRFLPVSEFILINFLFVHDYRYLILLVYLPETRYLLYSNQDYYIVHMWTHF